jgi:hypothetical protein
MMPPPIECASGGCPAVAAYRVVDVEGELRREVCAAHLPRWVARMLRRAKGGLVVEPVDAQVLGDLLPLLAIGASVYGLVADPTAALALANMSAETSRAYLETLSRVDIAPAVAEARDRVEDVLRLVAGDGARAEIGGVPPVQLFNSEGRALFDDDGRFKGGE